MTLSQLGVSLQEKISTADSLTIYRVNYATPNLKVKSMISVQTSDGYWISLPDPMSMKSLIYDVDSGDGTGRNQYGDLIRDRVNVKQKLICTFPPMMRSDYQIMVALTKGTSCNVRFYSDYNRGFVTLKMYVGDREPPLYKMYDPLHPEKQLVQSFDMNFIEF